ncbi:MAG: ankyrin repeat domain-containing protein [Elusimicrobiota bacterium]
MKKMFVMFLAAGLFLGLTNLYAEDSAVQAPNEEQSNILIAMSTYTAVPMMLASADAANSNIEAEPAQTAMPVTPVEKNVMLSGLENIDEAKRDIEETNALYGAFFVFARRGDQAGLGLLLTRGLDINNKTKNDLTALLIASREERVEVVSFLLEHGANINAVDDNGFSALRFAVEKKNAQLVNVLLKAKIDVNLQDVNGVTPFMYSISKGCDAITPILQKQKNLDVNIADKTGNTALMYAIRTDNVKLIDSIIKQKAYVTAKNNKGNDALAIAKIKGNPKVIKMMEKAVSKFEKKGDKSKEDKKQNEKQKEAKPEKEKKVKDKEKSKDKKQAKMEEAKSEEPNAEIGEQPSN